jgi:hypothetical protein
MPVNRGKNTQRLPSTQPVEPGQFLNHCIFPANMLFISPIKTKPRGNENEKYLYYNSDNLHSNTVRRPNRDRRTGKNA